MILSKRRSVFFFRANQSLHAKVGRNTCFVLLRGSMYYSRFKSFQIIQDKIISKYSHNNINTIEHDK